MQSTMQDVPLSISTMLRHGAAVYADSEVVTCTEHGARRASFAEVGRRAARLANALEVLGIRGDERVATFQWNNQEHLEAYLAVPSMGAVLHTLNIRLFPEQLVYIANHAEDKVVITDASTVALLAPVLAQMKTVEHVVVVASRDGQAVDLAALDGAGVQVHDYDELLAAQPDEREWAEVEERSAAAMCYTSGTTGNPKGVVYSHRSTYLHSLMVCSGTDLAVSDADRMLPIVPMFHANAWGLPYAAWFAGADLVLPDRYLAAPTLSRFIAEERPTLSGAVPTVWNDLLRYGETHELSVGSLRKVACGGAAVPLALMQAFQDRYGVNVEQAWGMTETSPVAAVARRPHDEPAEREWYYRTRTGRIVPGLTARLVDDAGTVLPADGSAVGELEIRGPWVTASYYGGDDPSRFHDGYLKTGDVGTLDPQGFFMITDRSKDVIKSGGEWISSLDLENALMGSPDVIEAAVVGVADERWQERPLACVVLRDGVAFDADALREFLADKVARWWLPERWTPIESVPKTSVGKFDKKVLRARYADGDLDVTTLPPLPR